MTSLGDAERFYGGPMGWEARYRDTDWRGWWSADGSVFGVYPAEPRRDGFPNRGVPSGYMSLWVRSAREARGWLARQGSRFPAIDSINDGRPGVNELPGYPQVAGTDSEGNLLVLTEYPGR